MRLLSVGVSDGPACGVRDYAAGLGDALGRRGHTTVSAWWDSPRPLHLGELHRGSRRWLDEVLVLAERDRPDVIVWHYSVFSYGVGGIPVIVPRAAQAVRSTGVPTVGVFHEYAYPWGAGGWRGHLWAVAHGTALPIVIRVTDSIVVTVEKRARSLRRHLSTGDRAVIVAPVFSNLPLTHAADLDSQPGIIGVLAYGDDDGTDVVMDALARVISSNPLARIVMLGAPGPDAAAGRRWLRAAREVGCADSIEFTGIVEAVVLATRIAQCDLVVFGDPGGPSSRKTTLAAALHAQVPVAALDGPETWSALRDANAVCLLARQPDQLSAAIAALLEDPVERAALAARGRQFYESHQDVDLVADRIEGALVAAVQRAQRHQTRRHDGGPTGRASGRRSRRPS